MENLSYISIVIMVVLKSMKRRWTDIIWTTERIERSKSKSKSRGRGKARKGKAR